VSKLVLQRPSDVLESVYDLDRSDHEWMRRITSRLDAYMGGGFGTVGSLFEIGESVQMPVVSSHEIEDRQFSAYQNFIAAGDDGKVDLSRFARIYPQRGMQTSDVGLFTVSANAARPKVWEFFQHEYGGQGVDASVLTATVDDAFISFSAAQTELSVVDARARKRWVALQRHVTAVLKLRRQLRRVEFDEEDAAWFDPDGDCLDRGPCADAGVRQRLRHLVRARDRNRCERTQHQRVEIQDYWSNVLAGKWALLDRFDSDGKRFVIAVPIHRAGDRLRGLSKRQREVVELLGDGLSNKAIAYELGISTTSVGSHLNNIYAKLGVQDRTSAVRLVRALRG
jgi:DNA-binding CsgD family transcriptional regulator